MTPRFRPFVRGRRPRAADDGKFLPRDLKTWRRLIKAARYQAQAPHAKADPLLKAADACGKAVVPPLPAGAIARTSCFVRLMALGRMWWRLDAGARAHQAADLLALAGDCQAVLDHPPATAPPLRRDIFG